MAFFMDMYFSVAEKYKKNYFLLALIKGEILTNGKVFKSHTRNQFLFHRQKKDAINILLVITLLQYVKVL